VHPTPRAEARRAAAARGSARRDQPSDVSRLQDNLGFWLRFVSGQVAGGLADRLQAEGVSLAEWVVLRSLFGATDASAARLVHTLGMTRGGVSKVLTRLHERGLVERAGRDDGDRRVQHLTLTRAGAGLVPRLAALADANDAAFFAPLCATERRELVRLLQALVQGNGLTHAAVD
jgi:DNA-binding MarR family transcriptional regulator